MFRSTTSKQRARERGKALARQWIDDVHAHGVQRAKERERRERWMAKLGAAIQELEKGIVQVGSVPTNEIDATRWRWAEMTSKVNLEATDDCQDA